MIIRILTYNIHGWLTADGHPNLAGVARVIEETGADIVGLNEVFHPRTLPGDPGPALDLLAQRANLHVVFGPCLRWPAQEHMPANAYGNALLSRWPIIASAAHHLTPKEEEGQQVLADKEPRGLLEARLLLPHQRSFTVYVTHLDHTDEEARLVQLRAARTWLGRDRQRPHVVMGDFNAITPWDFADRAADWGAVQRHAKGQNLAAHPKGPRVIAQMEKAGYVDSFRAFNAPGARSFLPADYALRIDYIFVSELLAQGVKSCTIWTSADEEPSDHRPVLMELAWEA
jgi:endonuclease/exonuclease/phosphatase family metal-dependent hydrolase